MATRQPHKMPFTALFTLFLVHAMVPGCFSTLRLYKDERFILPQDRGFAWVNADEQHLGMGTETQRQAFQGERQPRAPSLVHQLRTRRSSDSDSQPLKVYGKVSFALFEMNCRLKKTILSLVTTQLQMPYSVSAVIS